MAPVSGSVWADGLVMTHCPPLGGGGFIGWSRVPWDLKVGTNATSMAVTAQWTPTNPSIEDLEFEFLWQGAPIGGARTAPGGTFHVDVGSVGLDDRTVTAVVGMPVCQGEPVVYRFYENVEAKLAITFA